MIPEYLTSAEVAALYGVSKAAAGRWARTGKITGTRIFGDGPWRFPSAQFADVIRAAGGVPQTGRRS